MDHFIIIESNQPHFQFFSCHRQETTMSEVTRNEVIIVRFIILFLIRLHRVILTTTTHQPEMLEILRQVEMKNTSKRPLKNGGNSINGK